MSPPPSLAGDINVAALLADLERSHGEYLQQFRGKQLQLLNSNLGPQRPSPSVPVRFDTASPKSPTPPSAELVPRQQRADPRLKRLALPSPSPMDQDAPASIIPAGPSASAAKRTQADLSPASDASDEGFTTVESKATKKRKLKASKVSAKKQESAQPNKKAVVSSSEDSSSEEDTSEDSASEEEPMEQGSKPKTPPPIYVRQVMAWQEISKEMARQGIIFTTARSTAIGIRVQCPTSNDHRRLTDLLRQKNVFYHTYTLPEDKLLRVVIRGLPKELNTTLIKEDLQKQNLPVIEVARMRNFRTRAPYDMVLVSLELTPQGKNIFNIKTICSLSGLHIERPNNSGRISQCHRCQSYGHAARNCYAKPRCVKCLGDHSTSECSRVKDVAEEPVRCVLCKGEGHPANYRGCPKAPREPHRRSFRPMRSQDHKQSPKTFVPAPAPKANAWDKPLFNGAKAQPASASAKPSTVKPSPQTEQAPQASRAPQATKPAASETPRSVRNVAIFNEVREALDLGKIGEFVDTLITQGLTAALANFYPLLVKVDQLEKNVRSKYNL